MSLIKWKPLNNEIDTFDNIIDQFFNDLSYDPRFSLINTNNVSNYYNENEIIIYKQEKENENTESSKSEIGWGHQIRSYVLQPYRLVKDNRSNFESSNPDKILDGEIDEFLEQSLYQT